MKRSKKDSKKGSKTYRKVEGGIFRLSSGKVVKGGQVFTAHPTEIPKAFADLFVEVEEAKKEDKSVPTVISYTKKERTSLGWFDVVDSNGKVTNKTAMREDAADLLVTELTEALKSK